MLEEEPGHETDGKGYPDIYLTPNDTKGAKIYDQGRPVDDRRSVVDAD
jgi:hypothetical protein